MTAPGQGTGPAPESPGRPIEYCLLTAAYPQRGGKNRSGWGTYAETVTACLREGGVRVTIVLLEDDDQVHADDAFDDPSLVRVRLRFVRGFSLVAPGFVEGLTLLRAVRRLDRLHHFDVIEGPNVFGLCWAVAAGFPRRFILRAHTALTARTAQTGLIARWRGAFRRWLDGAAARRARVVVTHSRAHALTVESDYRVAPGRIVVVPHAIRKPAATAPGEPERILAIANAARRKGVDVLIEAFAGVLRRYPDARLTVVGCSPPDIERFAATLPGASRAAITARVAGVGQLADQDLELEWNRSGVVVIPSRYESFGLVAAEGMARGKVVIATDGGALGDVVGSGGLVVPTEDPAALQRAIESVLGSPVQRTALAAAGRARYAEMYQPSMLATRLFSLIESLG